MRITYRTSTRNHRQVSKHAQSGLELQGSHYARQHSTFADTRRHEDTRTWHKRPNKPVNTTRYSSETNQISTAQKKYKHTCNTSQQRNASNRYFLHWKRHCKPSTGRDNSTRMPSIDGDQPESSQVHEEYVNFPIVSLHQYWSSKRRTTILQIQKKRSYLEQSSVRREASQGSSMRRDESENPYTIDARDWLVYQNVRHICTRLLNKFIMRWYVYSPEVDRIKQPEDIPRHNIAHYEQNQRIQSECLISAQRANSQCKLLIDKS